MNRRLFNLAAAASLVLCVASLALFLRSFKRAYGVEYQAQKCLYRILSVKGDLFFATADRNADPALYPVGLAWESQPAPRASWDTMWYQPTYAERFVFFGFVRGGYYRAAFVPLWFIGVAGVPLPWIWLVRYRQRRRTRERGRCHACGYDLRATPQGDGPLLGRCPECGTLRETVT